MNILLCLPAFLCITVSTCCAQRGIWHKTYGDTGTQALAHSIDTTDDGGCVIAGEWALAGTVMRLSASGRVQWRWSPDTAFPVTSMQSVVRTPDGGCVAVGYGRNMGTSVSSRNFDGVILRFNSDGSVQWRRRIGGPHFDAFHCVTLTPDGGFVAAGHTYPTDTLTRFCGTPLGDAWAVKFSGTGQMLWQRFYAGTWDDQMLCIRQLTGGGFIALVQSESNDGDFPYDSVNGMRDNGCVLMKLSGDGRPVWKAAIGIPANYEYSRSVRQTPDGGFIVAGFSRVQNTTDDNVWIVKTTDSGVIQWERFFGDTGDDAGIDVWPLPEGGYLFAARCDGMGNPERGGYWVGRLSGTGVMRWEQFDGGPYDQATAIVCYRDGNCLVAGSDYRILETRDETRRIPHIIGGEVYYHEEPYINQITDNRIRVLRLIFR